MNKQNLSKKRKRTVTAILAATMLFTAGCSGKPDNTTDDTPGQSVASTMDKTTVPSDLNDGSTMEESLSPTDEDVAEYTVTGTLDTIKSFMFILTTPEGDSYSLPIDEANPVNLEGLNAGDTVTITYTGDLSTVETFTGSILSVTKSK